jgi:hypothetical protein
MFEPPDHPIASRAMFFKRVARHLSWGGLGVAVAVTIGTVGYHTLAHLAWLDAFLNASMILSGMGPVDRLPNDASKLFAALYALFSGLVFIAVMGVVLAPWIHRMMHRFHAEGRGR